MIYTKENGYGKVNLKEAEDAIRSLPMDHPGRQLLLELRYDYECLLRVIYGEGYVFRHEDGSETRRIKLW